MLRLFSHCVFVTSNVLSSSLHEWFQVCRRKILNSSSDFGISRGYASVGPMAPFYVFPCGHTFHAQCLIAHVTRSTDREQVSADGIAFQNHAVLKFFCSFNWFRCSCLLGLKNIDLNVFQLNRIPAKANSEAVWNMIEDILEYYSFHSKPRVVLFCHVWYCVVLGNSMVTRA